MPQLTFEGTVFSGTGQGRRFVLLPWVWRQIQDKLGFVPYPGTLNIRLMKESAQRRQLLENAEAMVIEPEAGYCPGMLFRAKIGELESAVVLPKVPKYPNDVLEVIAPVCLREKIKLVDGSWVVVEVTA